MAKDWGAVSRREHYATIQAIELLFDSVRSVLGATIPAGDVPKEAQPLVLKNQGFDVAGANGKISVLVTDELVQVGQRVFSDDVTRRLFADLVSLVRDVDQKFEARGVLSTQFLVRGQMLTSVEFRAGNAVVQVGCRSAGKADTERSFFLRVLSPEESIAWNAPE